MKSISISGTGRNTGKTQAARLRREGKVPCILYGGEAPVHFFADVRDFKDLVYSPDLYQVQISINGKEYRSMVKDVQFHPVSDKILHADFIELAENKAIAVSVPVRLTGIPAGVVKGGKLIQKSRRVNVRALPSALPEFIEVAVDELEIGDSIKAGDLSLPGAEVLESPNTAIAVVQIIREVVEAKPVAAAAEGEAAAPAEGAEASAGTEGEKAEGDKKEGGKKEGAKKEGAKKEGAE